MSVALPLLPVWVAAAVAALLDGRRRPVGWAALAAVVATLVALAFLAVQVFGEGAQQTVAGGWPAGVGIVLRADALGVLFALLSVGVIAAALVHELACGVRSRGFPALLLFMTAGLTGLFLTGDVFSFYVFFELTMIAAYAIAAYGGEEREVAAGFVFAVVNLLGSFVFLLAVAAIYHVTGTLEFGAVAARISEVEPTATILIAVGVFVAFGVKLGLFPFHFWLPAVYTGARPAVAAVLSGAVANIGSYGLLRFGGELLPSELRFGAVALIVLGSVSIVYGALQAVARQTAAGVIAYSSIGQVGYVLVALGVGSGVGIAAAVVFAVANALNKALLFLASDARGALVAPAFAIGALSVVGVPPTAGFFGKLELFRAGVADESAAIVALLVLGGALSFLYMFQIYQHDFWRGEREPSAGPGAQLVTGALAAVVLAAGLWPEPLLAAGREVAAALEAGAR